MLSGAGELRVFQSWQQVFSRSLLFLFFYCCVSCSLSRSHLEKHLQREGIAAHTHFCFQHLCSDESEFYSFADMSRKKSFTLFLNLKIWGELSSYGEISLCCSNHSSFPALVNVVHALMELAHIAQALLVFVMRIKKLVWLGGRKVAQDHFPFTTLCTVISSSPGWGVMWTGVTTLSPLITIMVRVIWRLLLMLCAGFILEVQHWLLSLSHV